MELIHTFWHALFELSNAMAPYILFGLLFAGILHELVPESLVSRHLGRDSIASVIKSTLFGIPLPVCSCGVIPLATAIKKSGASNGATLSFLISTPITGVDSILATYGMFGWAFTLYRVITSMLLAMIAGILTNLIGSETPQQSAPRFSMQAPQNAKAQTLTLQTSPAQKRQSDLRPRFSARSMLRYAFITLLGDIAKPLLWGLILGALITIAVPEDLSEILKSYSWLSYLIVILVAVPMYVCATASLPIAAGLILAGVSPGAAFVFLTAGPATNTVTIGVVKKLLGMRALLIYLGSIITGSILFGIGLDWLFGVQGIEVAELIPMHEEAGILAVVSSLLLWTMVFYHITRTFITKKSA